MSELREELSKRIKLGKQALTKGNFNLAITSFEKAITIASKQTPTLSSLLGIVYSYLALAYGADKQSNKSLEIISSATSFFSEKPQKPLLYASVLLGVGIEFQNLELFEHSVIILKTALKLTRKQEKNPDLQAISIVSRNLAFSYTKINNHQSAAKLYRIAADLEENSKTSLDLYRNSAFFFYEEGLKDEALNVLEIAYDKAKYLNQAKDLQKIADMQGLIAFEIYCEFEEIGYSIQALEYLKISYTKFKISTNQLGTIQSLYHQATLYGKLDENWQKNKILKEISLFPLSSETEEYVIKALLLLTIHSLESDRYNEAEYFLRQIPKEKIDSLDKTLREKVLEINKLLDISNKRGRLYSDLKFTRSALHLPVEDLLQGTGNSEQERINLRSTITNLQSTQTEGAVDFSEQLKPPTIETLEALFTSQQIEEELETFEQESLQIDKPSLIPSPSSQNESLDERTQALERLFRAHQSPVEVSVSESTFFERELEPPSIEESEEDITSFQTEVQSRVRSEENTRTLTIRYLQRAGWTVQLNFTNTNRRGAEPDLIAERGLIRRKRKLIFFAENPTDAEICSFLLQSNPESGEKIIFLLNGDPREANISLEVKLINHIDQLFK
ncbi:MAG: hypothetical protein EAX86_02275 [Candidatus Heimdallarchaeota archaeon]|nr:hypothetical protein [Candidatus Heimdallarchaeota archaeon]